MSEQQEIIINLFPNTGHHYHFIPMDLSAWLDVPSQWSHLPEGPRWLLWRQGTKENESGIWLCIETNQGFLSRSALVGEGEKGEGEPPPAENSPYVVESKTSELIHKFDLPGDVRVVLEWQQEKGRDPLDVDLIVDFGNTRTAVLALEHKDEVGRENLVDCCKSILFLKRGEEFEGETSKEFLNEDLSRKIVDSWFILREPEFDSLEEELKISLYKTDVRIEHGFFKDKKILTWCEEKRLPQMFVEVSPTIMGGECEERLPQANLEDGDFFTMSSPKRYLWDSEVTVGRGGKVEWSMLDREADHKTKSLQGTICRYTYENGQDWDIDRPPPLEGINRPARNPKHPGYPRRESMVWSALCILESAYRQITSYEWRKRDVRGITRRLKTIALTYPSGWVAEELEAYARAWNRAADIFALTHFEDPKLFRPEIKLEVDEAVASQLPFVYSEISRLGSVSEWTSLFGKEGQVRVMTIDIGGGTMDVSIVEYKDHFNGNPGFFGYHLDYKLLFRDCNTNAGDTAVKYIIERILLPQLFNCCNGIDCEDESNKELFRQLLGLLSNQSADREERSRITKLVFIPIVRKWLNALGKGSEASLKNEDSGEWLSIEELVGESGRLSLDEFGSLLREQFGEDCSLDTLKQLDYNPKAIEKCIEEALIPGIVPIAHFQAMYDVDVITLSGKITEIPIVRDLVKKNVYLTDQRLVRMKDYMAGAWCPMARRGRITDAKTVTVVGAALLRAINNKLLKGWSIKSTGSEDRKNFWGIMPTRGSVGGFQGGNRGILLDKDKEESEWIPIQVGTYIGRLSTLSNGARPEQIYVLRWKDAFRRNEESEREWVLKVKFKRVLDSSGERLEIVAAEKCEEFEEVGDNNFPVSVEDVELKLQTLEKERFWADEGSFNVCFEDENE